MNYCFFFVVLRIMAIISLKTFMDWILGAFAKLRKATIGFVMSVHP